MHYFELWRANEKSQEDAFAVLRRTMRSLEIVNLKSLFGITELKCVEDAWLLIF